MHKKSAVKPVLCGRIKVSASEALQPGKTALCM